MSYLSRFTVPILLGSVLFIQGCASAVVSDSDRDTTGLYDGRWKANVQRPAALQTVQNWRLTCESDPFELDLVVNDGQVYISSPGSDHHSVTNIDSRGRFSLEYILAGKAQASASSSSALDNGTRKLLLRGSLGKSERSGSFKVGIQQFAWQGCRAKVVYEQVSDDLNEIEI